MNMENDLELERKLKEIFEERFGIKENFWDAAAEDEFLLGRHFGFRSRHLLVLYNDIEDSFKIRIPDDDIINNNFTSYKKILTMIKRLAEDDGYDK
jgi:peptide maturation system acyl carrier-related protein